MKVKKILFFTLCIVLLIGLIYTCKGEENLYYNFVFQYKGINYNVDVKTYAEENNIDLNNYPYYFVGVEKNSSKPAIYYSKERIKIGLKNGHYYNYGSKDAYKIIINSDGTLTGSNYDMTNATLIYAGDYILSNQDIYHKNNLIMGKNHGYEYDVANEEDRDPCNDIVKIKDTTIVYQKPAINYNEIATLSSGDIVERIYDGINIANGYTWDKIKLSNGTEGYIRSDNIEITNDYIHIKFGYDNKTYNMYFSPSVYGLNIEDYPYYFVGIEKDSSKPAIYYSKERIKIGLKNGYERYYYYNYGSKDAYKIIINSDGTLTGSNYDMTGATLIYAGDYILSNHDIYYKNNLIMGTTVYEDISDVTFTKESSWEGIQMHSNVYAIIQQGEEEYNSMGIEEHLLLDSMLLESKVNLYGIILPLAQLNYKNAAPALMYFLSSGEDGKTDYQYPYETGIYKEKHTMRKIPLATAIEESATMKEKLDTTVSAVMNVAENIYIEDNTTINFYNAVEDSGEAARVGDSLVDSNADWFFAVNSYRIKIQSVVTRKGDNYELQMTYGLRDYYDWKTVDNEDYADMLGKDAIDIIIAGVSELLENLHKAGISRNYTNYGEIQYIIKWNKNERQTTGVYEIERKDII